VIDEADQQVKKWLEEVAGRAPVWLASGQPAPGASAVALHLLSFADAPAPRGLRQTPLQIRLRYLILVWDQTPEDEHRVLGKLLFAALEHAEWEVDVAPIALPLWQALGVAPRPAFALLVPLASQRVVPQAPLVGTAPRFRVVPGVPLRGRLLAGSDAPLAAARVELPALGAATETDADGNFSFGLVPRGASKQQLRVKARGDVQDFTVEVGPAAGPVTIKFRPPEG
jgi:hypothetical protein